MLISCGPSSRELANHLRKSAAGTASPLSATRSASRPAALVPTRSLIPNISAGARGVSAFVVRSEWEGVSRTVLPSIGSKSLSRGTISMDQTRVPRDHLIGEEGQGFRIIMSGFDYARAIIALMCLGTAAQSLDETIRYVKERQAFGRPIAKFEGVQFPIAEAHTMIEAADLGWIDGITHSMPRPTVSRTGSAKGSDRSRVLAWSMILA